MDDPMHKNFATASVVLRAGENGFDQNDLSACSGTEEFGWIWRFSSVNERSEITIGFEMKIMSFILT
jgi:hypothetical protein